MLKIRHLLLSILTLTITACSPLTGLYLLTTPKPTTQPVPEPSPTPSPSSSESSPASV